MRNSRKIIAILMILILAAAQSALAAADGAYDLSRAKQIVQQVNAERARYGMKPLTVSSELCKAAYTRALEIVKKFSHTRPNGSKWSTVSKKAYGENIARGHKTVDKVMAAWLTSSGHRANILKKSYGSIGVACVRVNNIWYWVQLFGK